MGPPEFSHQIESFLLLQTASCFTAGPWIYTGLLAPDTFLLHSRAPDLHWTSCARHLPVSQQGPGFTLDFLCQTPSCFTAGPRIYSGLPAPDTFLLHSRAPDLHWTFLDLPEHWCYYLSFSPLFQRAFFPGQGILDEPPNVLPVVRVPGRERRLLETMQLAIGEFITDSSQGLPPSPKV